MIVVLFSSIGITKAVMNLIHSTKPGLLALFWQQHCHFYLRVMPTCDSKGFIVHSTITSLTCVGICGYLNNRGLMWKDFKFSYSVDIEDCSENVELPKRISDEKCNPKE